MIIIIGELVAPVLVFVATISTIEIAALLKQLLLLLLRIGAAAVPKAKTAAAAAVSIVAIAPSVAIELAAAPSTLLSRIEITSAIVFVLRDELPLLLLLLLVAPLVVVVVVVVVVVFKIGGVDGAVISGDLVPLLVAIDVIVGR